VEYTQCATDRPEWFPKGVPSGVLTRDLHCTPNSFAVSENCSRVRPCTSITPERLASTRQLYATRVSERLIRVTNRDTSAKAQLADRGLLAPLDLLSVDRHHSFVTACRGKMMAFDRRKPMALSGLQRSRRCRCRDRRQMKPPRSRQRRASSIATAGATSLEA
jgi:hypothetical protein